MKNVVKGYVLALIFGLLCITVIESFGQVDTIRVNPTDSTEMQVKQRYELSHKNLIGLTDTQILQAEKRANERGYYMIVILDNGDKVTIERFIELVIEEKRLIEDEILKYSY